MVFAHSDSVSERVRDPLGRVVDSEGDPVPVRLLVLWSRDPDDVSEVVLIDGVSVSCDGVSTVLLLPPLVEADDDWLSEKEGLNELRET